MLNVYEYNTVLHTDQILKNVIPMQASHSIVWFFYRMEIKFFKGANVAFLN